MPISRSYQDEIGSEREYELIAILKPDCTKENIKTIIRRIMEMVEKNSGKLLSVENWGRRTLAYEIAKQRKGIYLYIRLLGYHHLIPEVERLLRMIEKVVRYQTIVVDANVDPSARPDQVDDSMLDALADISTPKPAKEAVKAEEPKAEEPKAEEPKAEEPKAEEPKAEEPKAEEPKAEEPKAEEATEKNEEE